MRELILDPQALEDLQWWLKTNKRAAPKIFQLMEEAMQTPLEGRGKPEVRIPPKSATHSGVKAAT